MARHTLTPERHTVHAHFSRDIAPCLEVESGDTVVCSTLDVAWGLEPPTSTTATRRKFEPRDPVADEGPCLLGPIAVRGAMPGDTLEIRIEALEPAPGGWTYAGQGITPPRVIDALGLAGAPLTLLRWSIDNAGGIAVNQFGHSVRIAPFLGIIGLAPGEPGAHSGWTPRACGGNMDCRELIAGTSLFLPVQSPGAMVSIGDGHAAQGDGEISGTAIECCMDRVVLSLHLHPRMRIAGPRARTVGGWVALGFGATLDEAMPSAMNSMLDLLMESRGVSRADALALASVCVDLRITQVVNGTVGVHAMVAGGAVGARPSPRA